jgi:hypothetical protein
MVYVFSTSFNQYSTQFEDGCELRIPSRIVVEADDETAATQIAREALSDRIKFRLKHSSTLAAKLKEWMAVCEKEFTDYRCGTAFFIEGDDLID